MKTTHFNLIDLWRTIRDQGAILSYAKYVYICMYVYMLFRTNDFFRFVGKMVCRKNGV